MSTPSSQPNSPTGESRAPRRREALRRALVVLVLAILGLLAWQLVQEHRQLLGSQKQLSLSYGEQLAKHLSLSMRLKAQAGQAMLHSAEDAKRSDAELLGTLRSIFPTLSSKH